MKSALTSIVFKLIATLPLHFIRSSGRWIGTLMVWLNASPMKVTRKNLSLCYPELTPSELERLAKNSVIETMVLALEVAPVWNKSMEWLNTVTSVKHEQMIQSALAENKGVVILAPHIGNWEVLGKTLPSYGQVVNLYAPPKNQSFEAMVKRSREASGAKLVPTNSRGIATLLKHLKNGGITGILPDQVPPQESGDYAPFFGVNALTMTLLHGLYKRTKCKILVAAALRTDTLRSNTICNSKGFEIHFLEPDEQIYSEDLKTSLAGLNKSVEKIIALAPEQYQWEYKRFKRQPDKSVSYYDELV